MENIKNTILSYIQIYQNTPIKLIPLVVDLVIVFFLAYYIFKFAKQSRAWQLIKGLTFLAIATWASKLLNLNIRESKVCFNFTFFIAFIFQLD